MNKGIIAALLCLLASPSFAQEAFTPDVYSRMSITLIPKIEPKPIPAPLPKPLPLPKQPAEETEPKGKLHTKAEEKEKEKKKEEMKAIRVGDPVEEERPLALPPRTPITYNVEVKTPDFLTQEDFITHSDFAEHEGLLILIEPVGVATVNATLMLSAADVLFINEDGFIT